jgi:hypothetical protein
MNWYSYELTTIMFIFLLKNRELDTSTGQIKWEPVTYFKPNHVYVEGSLSVLTSFSYVSFFVFSQSQFQTLQRTINNSCLWEWMVGFQ